uniref:PA0069 family radical SAM protein n=1 Tax=Dulem virus 36 TaxID=3145754 RepID=A0AAU8B0G4_9CAUD
MSIIYQPRGKAREYSPLALNIYMGCSHNCKYCYAPACIQKAREAYYTKPSPRRNLLFQLEKELEKRDRIKEQVLLSFVGDVYCETQDNNETTREVLKLLLKYKVPVAILTKGGERCLKDIDLFKKFGEHIQVGTTLTFDNADDSLDWESGAAIPEERLDVLFELKKNGIKTFASFEPVIIPGQSLNLMEMGLDCIDTYKIGKINNYKGIDKTIDWTYFLKESLNILRPEGKSIYIKHDLRMAAPSVKLFGNEVLPDEHNVH